jgi:hypothetical protein
MGRVAAGGAALIEPRRQHRSAYAEMGAVNDVVRESGRNMPRYFKQASCEGGVLWGVMARCVYSRCADLLVQCVRILARVTFWSACSARCCCGFCLSLSRGWGL